jgi:hypothetical protein
MMGLMVCPLRRLALLLIFSLTLLLPSFSQGEGVKGKVTSVLRDTIKLDIGSDEGIQLGDIGKVFYLIQVGDKEKPIFIAKVTITQVQEKVATARIKEDWGGEGWILSRSRSEGRASLGADRTRWSNRVHQWAFCWNKSI